MASTPDSRVNVVQCARQLCFAVLSSTWYLLSSVDLTQGTEYSFSVEAFTRNGSGPASPWVSAHTFAQDLGGQPTC